MGGGCEGGGQRGGWRTIERIPGDVAQRRELAAARLGGRRAQRCALLRRGVEAAEASVRDCRAEEVRPAEGCGEREGAGARPRKIRDVGEEDGRKDTPEGLRRRTRG